MKTSSIRSLRPFAVAAPADAAWSSALNEQIAEYNSAPDEYLQARSSDLADLRDRVLRTLARRRRRGLENSAAAPWSAPTICRRRDFSKSIGRAAAAWRCCAAVRPATSPCWRAPAAFRWSCNSARYPTDAETALLDGEGATLELDPSSEQIGLFERRRELHRKNRASARSDPAAPAASWGGERIRLLINIQRVEDLDHPDAQYADGIGLMRTEFLLAGRAGLPDEETQYQAYDGRAALGWQSAGDDSDLRCRR